MKTNVYKIEDFAEFAIIERQLTQVNVQTQLSESFIPEGKRNSTLTSLGGTMLKRGMSIESVDAALHAENRSRCRPSLPEVEVSGIVRSISRYEEIICEQYRKHDVKGEITPPSSTGVDDRRGFHFIAVGEMLAAPMPIDWLIKGFLDANCLASLFGEPGCMKTFVAIDLALCVATGRDWHGHPIRRSGPVFYIAGEGFAGLNRRVKAWGIANKTDLTDVPFFVSDRPAQFLDVGSAAEVVAAVDELQGLHKTPVLIIIDTLNRNFGSGNESDTADMTKFVGIIDASLRCRYPCAVLIVHHPGLQDKHRARGSVALYGALDWEYRLVVSGDIRTLINSKVKDHEPPPSISFRPEIIALDGWLDPDDRKVMTSVVLHHVDGVPRETTKPLTRSQKIAFDALVDAIAASGVPGTPEAGQGVDRVVHVDTWRKAAYAAGISPTPTTDAKKIAFRRAISDLREGGWIATGNDFWWPIRDKGRGRDITGTCSGDKIGGQGHPP